ncbi:SMODS domain-containing nucleotidyltransferase [Pyxidicoccus sp. MSG2]|uniref:SMODS domain-containing nucleotidyltransferase n=1 Tax=Pyxidicoccus sp. MSG2 TaxID=2996790 RepID=UPI00226F72D0|nr:hypothetical protein [Pyxidicoccus sp. MSG2]MCY1022128.1 hypothetical protein [Pyxidicoccus sp. MSG2]
MNLDFLDEQMAELSRQLEPSEAQRSAARKSQRAIREALDSGNMASRIITDYLSGSYARHTAIAPIDDVDIIFVIDPSKWRNPGSGGRPAPEKVLETFAGAIRLRRDSSTVMMQRRSVGLKMHHLHIDAVPAIETERDGLILIPDRRKEEWILTGPKIHAERATALNQKRGNMFKPLVKILKGWNSQLDEDTAFKSFSLETMALRIFEARNFDSMFEGVLLFFDFLCGRFAEDTHFEWPDSLGVGLSRPCFEYQLLDIAGTGSNLFANLSDDRRGAFLEAALRTRDLLWKAKCSRSRDQCLNYLEEAFPDDVNP